MAPWSKNFHTYFKLEWNISPLKLEGEYFHHVLDVEWVFPIFQNKILVCNIDICLSYWIKNLTAVTIIIFGNVFISITCFQVSFLFILQLFLFCMKLEQLIIFQYGGHVCRIWQNWIEIYHVIYLSGHVLKSCL